MPLFHSRFPNLTPKQIKRKVNEVRIKNSNKIHLLEAKAERERRKSFFDE